MKNVFAVIVGLAVGMGVNMALGFLNGTVLYPMPEGTDVMDTEQMNAYIETLPTPAFLVILAAHLGQAFVGGFLAAKMGASRKMTLAMIVGVLSLVGGILNMINFPATPNWMLIEMPLYLVCAWAAGKLAIGREAA